MAENTYLTARKYRAHTKNRATEIINKDLQLVHCYYYHVSKEASCMVFKNGIIAIHIHRGDRRWYVRSLKFNLG